MSRYQYCCAKALASIRNCVILGISMPMSVYSSANFGITNSISAETTAKATTKMTIG